MVGGGGGGGVRLWHYGVQKEEVLYCRLLMGGCVVIDSPLRLEYLLLLTKDGGLFATDNNECTSCITIISMKERSAPVRAGESVGWC